MISVKNSTAEPPLSHYILVLSVAILVFLNSLHGDFVFDDGPAIVKNADVLGMSSLKELLRNDFWGNEILHLGSHKSYRPLTTLSFRLTHSLFGLSPTAFHLGNILLHGVVSCLVLWLAGRLKLKKYTSLTTSLIFAVHPVHCESVASIVGRSDQLATFFVLSGLFLWDKFQSLSINFFLTLCALFSKEIGLVLPLLVITFDFSRHQSSAYHNRKQHFLLGIYFIFIAFLRVFFTGSPSFSMADNPLPHEKSLFTRLATTLYLPIFHLQLLVFPKDLCFDWSMGAIPLVSSVNDIRLWLSLALYLLGLALLVIYHKKVETSMFALFFGVISFLPASNIFINVGFLAAERVLYLPSIGYSILFALILEKISKRSNLSFPHLVLAILAILSARTIRRNEDWRTSESLYKSALHLNPAKAYSNLGQALAANGDSHGAAEAYEKALNYRNMADTWYNLGVLQSSLGNYSQAVVSYTRAIRIRQSFAAAHLNLGISLRKQRRFREAEEIFNRCLKLNGRQTKYWKNHREAQSSCLLNRGLLRKHLRKFHEARADLLVLVEDTSSEGFPLAATSLAEIDLSQGNISLALERIQQPSEALLNYIPAILLHAKVLLSMGDTKQAEKILWDGLNRVSLQSGKSSLMNELALLLAEHSPEQAELLLREASNLSASHVHQLNYAVILHKRGKYMKAKRVYEKILHLEPGHSLAWENLKKLQREMEKST